MANSDVDGFMEPVNKWQDIDGVNGLVSSHNIAKPSKGRFHQTPEQGQSSLLN